ncbi:MAG: hypothetical protein IPL53_03710 [Ignavibacteria bacterium]|nr:hypothetical protein [Ignavibacteria bacterium]
MNVRIFPGSLFLIFVLTFLSGCDDSTGPVSTVTGKVVSSNNQPVFRIKVMIGDKSTYTSYFGTFTFSNVEFPYDVKVIDSLGSNAYLFKGLSTGEITLPLRFSSYHGDIATIKVTLPDEIMNENLNGKIIFTDGNTVNFFQDISEQSSTSAIFVPVFGYSLTGKIILLTYKKDADKSIVSYENYGESPFMSISPYQTYYYAFDSVDIALDPGEETVSGNFILPDGYNSTYASFFLSFASNTGSGSPAGYGLEFSEITENPFSIKIPTGLPRQFSTIVLNSAQGNSGGSFESFPVSPGSSNDLILNEAPVLISPDNNEKNVNDGTVFSFSNSSPQGIYRIQLLNISRYAEYTIVTANNNFTFDELDQIGFGNMNNNYFRWLVEKTGPAGSMNEYVTNNTGSFRNFIQRSNEGSFSTEP